MITEDPENLDNSRKMKSSSHLRKDVKKDREVYHIPISSGQKKQHSPQENEPEEGPVEHEKSMAKIEEALPEKVETKKAVESAIKIVEEAQKEAGFDKDEEIVELNERIKRISADFENFRRRKDAEVMESKKYAGERLILELLPIMDNFERALSTSKTSRNFESLVEGVQMIYRQMKEVLEKEGVKEIESQGQSFDPALHQAVMMVEDDRLPDDTVAEQLLKGYKLKDKVIRPSMVKVSRKKA